MLRRQDKQLFWLGQKWGPGFCGLLNFVCVRGKWGKTTFLSFFAQVSCLSCAVPSTSFVLTSSWLCRRPQTDLNSSMYQFRFSLYLHGHKDKSTVFDLTNLHSEYLLKHLLANSLSPDAYSAVFAKFILDLFCQIGDFRTSIVAVFHK